MRLTRSVVTKNPRQSIRCLQNLPEFPQSNESLANTQVFGLQLLRLEVRVDRRNVIIDSLPVGALRVQHILNILQLNQDC